MKHHLLAVMALVVMCTLASCQPNRKQLLESRLQTLSESTELGTVEYTVKKIVKSNDKQWYTVGDRRILFQTTAYLKAGIKLDGFGVENIKVDNDNNAVVTLPHAQLLSFNMPDDEISTVFEDYGYFRSKFNAEEQNKILRLGEENIRNDVQNLGILQDAEKNADEIFTALLQPLNYKTITIKFE